MNEKKNLAITFGITGNYAFALGNVLLGLKKHNPDLDADIIVFEQEVSEKDKSLLNLILPCKFIQYKFPYDVFLTKDTLKRFSELTFSRFECFKFLNQYKKVLWLDVDILVCQDIQQLLDEHSTGISLASGDEKASDFEIEIDDIPHYNAGVMYLQDNLPNYEILREWCYNKTQEYSTHLKCADQGIINLMIKEHNLNVHWLHWRYNYTPAYGEGSNVVIYHSFCPEKFWDYWNFKEWNENNEEWIKMGGSQHKFLKNNKNNKSKIYDIFNKIIHSIFYNLYIYKLINKKFNGIHLGCGNTPIKGFLNIDANLFSKCDAISGINKIKLARDSVDCIYSSHVFEHIPRHDALNVLFKWCKVLRPGGKLYLCIPDLEALIKIYLKNLTNFESEKAQYNIELAAGIMYGGQSNKYDYHFFGYSFLIIEKMLKSIGFKDIKRFNPDDLTFKDFVDASSAVVEGVPVSLNIMATK